MKIACAMFFTVFCVLSMFCCSTPHPPSGETPPVVNRNTLAEAALSAGWPFPVAASVGGFDLPRNFVSRLRAEFLAALAGSRFARRIARIEISAQSGEYEQWSCVVHLTEGMQPIRLEHFAGFYDGRASNHYAAATHYVLESLRRIEQHMPITFVEPSGFICPEKLLQLKSAI